MNDSNFKELLHELLRRTRVGDLRWEVVDDGARDVFLAAFDTGMVRIRQRFEYEWDDCGREPISVEQMEVRLIDAQGEVVMSRLLDGPRPHHGVMGYVPSDEYNLAFALWNAARETARNADELLDAILREVRGELQTAA